MSPMTLSKNNLADLEYRMTAQYKLDLIPIILNKHGITFSKTVSSKLVGGRGKLGRLIEQGKIRVEKKTSKQNGKWYCYAGDVILHMKLSLPK